MVWVWAVQTSAEPFIHPPSAGSPKSLFGKPSREPPGAREAHCVITGIERTGWRSCERVRARGDRDRGGRQAHRSGADDHGRDRSGAVLPEHRRRLRFRAGRRPRPAGRRRGGGSLGQHRASQRGARLTTTASQSLTAGPSPCSAQPLLSADLAQRRPSTFIACAAIRDSPRAFRWTITAFVPWSTGSTQRRPRGWQASWPSEILFMFTQDAPVAAAARRTASFRVAWMPRRYGTSPSAIGIRSKQPPVVGMIHGYPRMATSAFGATARTARNALTSDG